MKVGHYVGVVKEFDSLLMSGNLEKNFGELRITNIEAESRAYKIHFFFFVFLTLEKKIPDEAWDKKEGQFIQYFPPGDCSEEMIKFLNETEWVKL